MYKITKENLYEKREMAARRKPNSTFSCAFCKEKLSILSHTYFYLISEYLTGPLESSGRFCSTDCVFKQLDLLNIEIDKIIKEHNLMMDMVDKND